MRTNLSQVGLQVSPPRERPNVSREGRVADFLSFDPAPCVDLDRREDLRVDVDRRRVAGTGGVLMRPNHAGVDPDRPLPALGQVGAPAELVEDLHPRSVA